MGLFDKEYVSENSLMQGVLKMKKSIKWITMLIGIVVLTGCGGDGGGDSEAPLSPPDFSTEQGIKEYLVGEWFGDVEYLSDMVVHMNIDKKLNVTFSFHNSLLDEPGGDYKGKIAFDRVYASADRAPDIIRIELEDTEVPGGDFFFLHRTLYDGKRVMSLIFAGNGNSVFDILAGDIATIFDKFDDDDRDCFTIRDVMLDKVTGETPQQTARINDAFYAVFWGHGEKYETIWFDDVTWTPSDDDFEAVYPRPMTLYENDICESVLYNIDPDKKFELLGADVFKGTVYHVTTDDEGNIIDLINAEYKQYLEKSSQADAENSSPYYKEPEDGDTRTMDLAMGILTGDITEVTRYLHTGMDIMYTGDISIHDGAECYGVALGTAHEDYFVKEIHYAVNINTRQCYRYDALTDSWEELS